MGLRQDIANLDRAGMASEAIANQLECSKRTVDRVKAKIKSGGDVAPVKPPGRPAVKTAPAALRRLKMAIERHPRRSYRDHSRQMGIAKTTVLRCAKKIGAKSRIRQRKPLLTPDMRQKRRDRAKALLNDIKSAPPGRIIFYSDEKTFCVSKAYNRHNVALSNAKPAYADKYTTSSKHHSSLMFLGAMASTGEVSPPIWFPVSYRLNAGDYIKELDTKLIPWMRSISQKYSSVARRGQGDVPAPFVWMQDAAPAHTANTTQKFLEEQGVPFWTKSLWPPNSPDLNPLDFSVWNAISTKACTSLHPNTESLRRAVTSAWRNLDPAYIVKTCAAFRKRLQQVVDAEGSIIK